MVLSLSQQVYEVTIYEETHYTFLPIWQGIGSESDYSEAPVLNNDVYTWMFQNYVNATLCDIDYDEKTGLTKGSLLFTDEEKAMAFKLRWL